MIVDLTMAVDIKTQPYPGNPPLKVKDIETIKSSGWNVQLLHISSHFGTHLDAPYHRFEKGKKLDEFKLETFIGTLKVIDVQGQQEINVTDEQVAMIEQGDIVFFFTNHSLNHTSKEYFKNNPVISRECALKLIEQKVKLVGIDSFSVDNDPRQCHDVLLGNDILILENLVNLDKIVGKSAQVMILPLKISNADGAPARVITKISTQA